MTHVVHLEDDAPLREVFKVAFQTADLTVDLKQFWSSDDAWRYIEANGKTIDIFILDIRVPGSLTGIQLAEKIRALGFNMPIVVTSAYQPPNPDDLKKLRCEWYPKPWHLIETIEKLINISKTTEEIKALSMHPCPICDHYNVLGATICEKCDAELMDEDATMRFSRKQYLDAKKLAQLDAVPAEKTETQVAPRLEIKRDSQALPVPEIIKPMEGDFPENGVIRLEVGDLMQSLFCMPKASEPIVIGRIDPSALDTTLNSTIEVDLGPLDGYRLGVSRRHAVIRRSLQGNNIEIWDMGSSNGTFLKGERLVTNKPYRVYNGDEIKLGQLSIKVFFQKDATVKPSTPRPAASSAAYPQLPGTSKLDPTVLDKLEKRS